MDRSSNKVKNKSPSAIGQNTGKNKGSEKRRNNEKRKEKSRDAARCRRSRETEIFTDLSNVLPVRREDVEQLDKASVMRLSIAYLKVRNMLEFFPQIQKECDVLEKKEIDNDINIEESLMQALDGFLLILSSDGDIIFVSEIVSEYLGIQQIDIIGQQIWDYTHQCDHDELREILKGRRNGEAIKASENDVKSIHRDLFLRLKCTLTSRGRNVNIKSASYKVIHVTGHTAINKDGDRILVAVGRPVPHPSNIEEPLNSSTFLTKHSLDMKFSYVDDKMLSLLGYAPEHLMNESLYDYHHSADSENLHASFKNVISKGQSETCRYRFLARSGGYCWVVTQATLVYDKQKPQRVVCVNYIVSGVENENEIYSWTQLEAQKLRSINEQQQQQPQQSDQPQKQQKTDETIIRNNLTCCDTDKPLTVTVKSIKEPPLESFSCQQLNKQQSPTISYRPSSTIAAFTKDNINNNRPRSVTASVFCPVSDLQPSAIRPQSVTSSLFNNIGGVSRLNGNNSTLIPATGTGTTTTTKPQSITSKLFAPRTGDMNKTLFKFLDEGTTDYTMLKEESDDLSHLAPTAGDACIPLDDSTPLFGEMFESLILPDGYGSLLQDDINSIDSNQRQRSKTNIDPFINYRDDSCDTISTPNLLSPGDASKSPHSSSLPSLCSPNSLCHDDEFAFMTMNCDDDIDLAMRAPYIPMNENDDLPLLTEDLMWSAFSDELHKDIRETTTTGETVIKESSLAALLSPDGIIPTNQNAQIDFKRNKVIVDREKNDNLNYSRYSNSRDTKFNKNCSNQQTWTMNGTDAKPLFSSTNQKPMNAVFPIQIHKSPTIKKPDRSMNKRPLNTSTIDLNTTKRIKAVNNSGGGGGGGGAGESRSSPQLLQQLMASTPTPRGQTKDPSAFFKNDLGKWNSENSTQQHILPPIEPVSNSVLKNLLNNLSMKPPDILLAETIKDRSVSSDRLNRSNTMNLRSSEPTITTTNHLNPIKIHVNGSQKQILPPDDTEIPHPPAPNNKSNIFNVNSKIKAQNIQDIDLDQDALPAQQNVQLLTNDPKLNESTAFMMQNPISPSNLDSNNDNIPSIIGSENKRRKVSFSSLDGDILPIPIQSLLLELSDQDFEMSVPINDDQPFGKDSILNTSIDQWANEMT